MNRTYRYYDLIMAAFVAVLLVSNIASSAKIVDWGVSLPADRTAAGVRRRHAAVSDQLHLWRCADRGLRLRTGPAGDLGRLCLAALMGATLWLVARLPGEAAWQA